MGNRESGPTNVFATGNAEGTDKRTEVFPGKGPGQLAQPSFSTHLPHGIVTGALAATEAGKGWGGWIGNPSEFAAAVNLNLDEDTTLTALREDLLDGLERFSPEPTTQCWAISIAIIRALVFFTLTAFGMLAFLYGLDKYTFKESRTTIPLAISAQICHGSLVSTTDPSQPRAWEAWLGPSASKSIVFSVNSRPDWGTITYWDNEELFNTGIEPQRGFTFGIVSAGPLRVNLDLDPTGNCASSDADSIRRLGFTLTRALSQAGQRVPSFSVKGAFALHGAILIRNSDNTIFSSTTNRFQSGWSQSPGWLLYMILTWILRIALAMYLSKWFITTSLVLWDESVDDWIIQYDFLWNRHLARTEALISNPKLVAEMAPLLDPNAEPDNLEREREKVKEVFSNFARRESYDTSVLLTRFESCSPWFVIDSIHGNFYMNSEHIGHAVSSAVMHAVWIVLPTIFLVLLGMYFTWALRPVQIFLAIHGVAGLLCGLCYYSRVTWVVRVLPFTVHFLCVVTIWLGTLFYLSVLLISLATHLITNTNQVLAVLVPLVSIGLYIVYMTKYMLSVRQLWKDRAAGADVPKGIFYNAVIALKLSTSQIVGLVAWTTFIMVLLVTVLIIAGSLYVDKSSDAQLSWVPTLITPILVLVNGWNRYHDTLNHFNNAQNLMVQLML